MQTQAELNTEMVQVGRKRMKIAAELAEKREEVSSTPYAHRLMAGDGVAVGGLEAFAAATREWITLAKGTTGKRHSVIATLEEFDSLEVVAFLTLKTVFDCLIKRKDLTATAVYVGKALEDELRFKKFESENPAFWGTLIKDLTKREPNMERRRGILIHKMNTDTQATTRWEPWTVEKRVNVGLKCINLVELGTGLVKIVKVRERKKTVGKIEIHPDTMVWIQDFLERGGIVSPSYLPMVSEPKAWDIPCAGGYDSMEMNPLRLVKVFGPRGTRYLSELAQAPAQMRQVYRAVNAVQSTPWKINRSILAIMHQAQDSKLAIGKAPMCLAWKDAGEMNAYMPLPPKPADISSNEEALTLWKRAAAKVHSARAKSVSKSLQHTQLLWLADKFEKEEAIYFPMQLDFRGRMYAVPSNLNPQSSDPAKGLLTFARGCKLGAGGWKWLHIHIANMHGEDKISFDDREQWTVENYHWIVDCVKEPFAHREWMDADKPWQFLAGAMELVAAVESGDYENYVSNLPVTVDGTCNGLQHFSAMLLDQDGAASVNLQPSEVPSDIYQIVADKVKAKFATMDDPLAKAWLEWGFDRKATKRAVMIVPYSGTQHAVKDYTVEYLSDRIDLPFEDERYQAAQFFAEHVWEAIGETVVSARLAMGWFRKLARANTKAGRPMNWVTPIGMPIRQDYRNTEQYRVKTRLGHNINYRPVLLRETERLDNRKCSQGISPNIIHSLDAACLMLTVCRSLDEDIQAFAMVHDSYGVLAGKMDTLYMGLRQAFVDVYQNDVLESLLVYTTQGLSEKAIKKLREAMPRKGSFQLESVKQSKYFFA